MHLLGMRVAELFLLLHQESGFIINISTLLECIKADILSQDQNQIQRQNKKYK
jgi:hypothetical protein